MNIFHEEFHELVNSSGPGKKSYICDNKQHVWRNTPRFGFSDIVAFPLFFCTRIAAGSLSSKPHTNPFGSLEDTPGPLFTPTPTCLLSFFSPLTSKVVIHQASFTACVCVCVCKSLRVCVARSHLPFRALAQLSACVLVRRCAPRSLLVKMSQ